MVLLIILVDRYWTAILLTFDAAALSKIWLEFLFWTISQSPRTDKGLMLNMESY
jgi:hypothetical protein